jgi:23S rRNA pseudouridine2605 synthase
MNLLPEHLPPRVVPVGRLDRDSEGLLLFTNDGELAHRATHPSYGVDKEYLAEVRGEPGRNALRALRRGVDIGEGHRTALAEVELSPPPRSHSTREGYAWLRLVLREGRRREVRLMCAAAGHPVRTLVRTRVGPVKLGRLPTGRTRPLTQRELVALRRLAGLAPGHAAL